MSRVSSHSIRFRLALSSERYLAYYQGKAQNIVVRSEDNRNIKFPASAVRRFLTHEGVFGLFEIQFDKEHKLIGVKQVST
jgi:Protein of unknown function (DUF2835)